LPMGEGSEGEWVGSRMLCRSFLRLHRLGACFQPHPPPPRKTPAQQKAPGHIMFVQKTHPLPTLVKTLTPTPQSVPFKV
jgi:hypothetical protein